MTYEKLGSFRSTLVLLFFLIGLWYLIWRATTLAADAPIFSWALYLAEIYGFIAAILHNFMTWRLTDRHPVTPVPGLKVDVFIATYNEPIDIVRKTLLAAKHMDYPHATWLLDDGNRPEMEALAKRLDVRYITRENNDHAKAGNLNNALRQTEGEFIAIFDADHAPKKNFLNNTLGFFADDQVAFVQTPQEFFNLDSYQHRWQGKGGKLWTEQSLFFKVIQRGKDYWNAAFFCGSCAVVRRSSLNRIGGFATETITEDIHTSIKFHKAGFRSVYLAQSLAYGIAPTTISPFLHQRIRWGQGAMQVLRRENIFFTSQLTIAQRLNYLASILTYFDGWQKGLFYIAPTLVLITGILPMQATGFDFLVHFIPYYLLSIWVFEEMGRGYAGMLYNEQYNFARFAAFAWATLGLFVGKLQFKVTSKVRSNATSSLQLFLPQFAILILSTAAIPIGLILYFESVHLPRDAMIFNIFWASVNIAFAAATFSHLKKTQAFLRHEYRFPIPLPICLRKDGHTFIATVDNISSSGCRIYGKLPPLANKGAVKGEIYLPSGPLEIQVEVMSESKSVTNDEEYVKAVGCRFIWNDPRNQDMLELFLYGTDLQWQLLEIKEKSSTPIQWLQKIISRKKILAVNSDEYWATFSFSLGESEPLAFGLIPLPSNESQPRQIIMFASQNVGTQIVLNITTRTRQIDMQVIIQKGVVLENSAGAIYLYTIENCMILPEPPPQLESES